ncbi:MULTISPECIES: barnase inhibitor [Arthrobacter]|uniref:Barnase inhibitor n=1 Tax=Arthrobacter oryzae TaxID=409290 RepID=A0A3N0BMW8_9MICC|nr:MULTISPECIES: barnase inhibitor [Arthrobacter]QYF88439.1 barnase inhibitor [Arthrobacter sp. PAMC25284]RNL50071.1 barnase inhibitor [Arthrobacter oryzae]
MKIYSADTWTIEELKDQIDDAGRRALVIPAADSQRALLETFSEILDVQEDSGVDLDILHDSLHDVADAVADQDQAPVTFIWQVPAGFRADRSFGVFCETLQDAESYAAGSLDVVAVFL